MATVGAAGSTTEANFRSCSRMTSVLNFMDDLYFDETTGLGYHLLQEDLLPQEFDLDQGSIDTGT